MAVDTRSPSEIDEDDDLGFKAPNESTGGPWWENGEYVATVIAVENAPPSTLYPDTPQMFWRFAMSYVDSPEEFITIEKGEKAGQIDEVWIYTGTATGEKSKAGPMIAALIGRPLRPDEKPSRSGLAGKRMKVYLTNKQKKDGGWKPEFSATEEFTGVRPQRRRGAPQTEKPRFDDEDELPF